jgi:hypothetical protein
MAYMRKLYVLVQKPLTPPGESFTNIVMGFVHNVIFKKQVEDEQQGRF